MKIKFLFVFIHPSIAKNNIYKWFFLEDEFSYLKIENTEFCFLL